MHAVGKKYPNMEFIFFEKYDRTMTKREVILHGLRSEAEGKSKLKKGFKSDKYPIGRHLKGLLLAVLAGGAVGAGAGAIHDHMTKKPKK
jgi:hypothetical protein